MTTEEKQNSRSFITANAIAAMVLAGITLLGFLLGLVAMWVNFNVKLAEIQLKHESLTLQVQSMDIKMKSIEQSFNDMNLRSTILDERQQTMNAKLEKILQILEKKYENKRTSYHLQIEGTDTMGMAEIKRMGFHPIDCLFCPDVLLRGNYGQSVSQRTGFKQGISL